MVLVVAGDMLMGLQGATTKRTITLQINSDNIKVFIHDEDVVALNETVPFTVCKDEGEREA